MRHRDHDSWILLFGETEPSQNFKSLRVLQLQDRKTATRNRTTAVGVPDHISIFETWSSYPTLQAPTAHRHSIKIWGIFVVG